MVLYGLAKHLDDLAISAFSALNRRETAEPTLAWDQWRTLMDEFQAAQFHFLSNVCISHMHAINVSLLDEEEANGTSGLDSLPMETMQLEETCKSLSDDEGKAQPQWAAFEGSSGSAKPPLLSPNDEFSLENASSESEASVVDWNPGSRKRKAKPSSPKSRKRNIFPSRATKKATSNKLAANADTSSATLQIRGSRKKLETTANPATASTTAEKSGKAVAEPDTSGRLNLKVADEQDIGMGESDSDDENSDDEYHMASESSHDNLY